MKNPENIDGRASREAASNPSPGMFEVSEFARAFRPPHLAGVGRTPLRLPPARGLVIPPDETETRGPFAIRGGFGDEIGVARIVSEEDPAKPRDDLPEHLQAFSGQLEVQVADTGSLPPGRRSCGPSLVAPDRRRSDDDGNLSGGGQGRQRGVAFAGNEDVGPLR